MDEPFGGRRRPDADRAPAGAARDLGADRARPCVFVTHSVDEALLPVGPRVRALRPPGARARGRRRRPAAAARPRGDPRAARVPRAAPAHLALLRAAGSGALRVGRRARRARARPVGARPARRLGARAVGAAVLATWRARRSTWSGGPSSSTSSAPPPGAGRAGFALAVVGRRPARPR